MSQNSKPSPEKIWKKQFSEWRRQSAKKSSVIGKNTKEIRIPELNEKLAEFIGAYLGDGTLTEYFIRIFSEYRYCSSYLIYLQNITKQLFGVEGIIKNPKNRVAYLEITSVKLCKYLKNEFNFSFGSKIKNKTVIPNQILKKDALAKACLRGLMDTDGSMCKRGNQMSLAFTAHNPYLLRQVKAIGQQFEVFSHANKVQVGTNSWPRIVRYFQIVGSSNITHIIRFRVYYKSKKQLCKADTLAYIKKYSGIQFPYIGPVV